MKTQVVESPVTHLKDQDNFLLTEKPISVDCINPFMPTSTFLYIFS